MRDWINMETWNRSHLFRSYCGTDFPYINITCELDITSLYAFVKANGLSLYFAMIYLVTKAANEIENFKFRMEDGKPFRIAENVAYATHIPQGAEIFQMVKCDWYDSLEEFARKNREKAEIPLPESGLNEMKGRMDILNITCIPWVAYTGFDRTIAKAGVDCNPKISFGKYQNKNGRIVIPFSVLAHHGLMDGYHVGKYIQLVESYLEKRVWESEKSIRDVVSQVAPEPQAVTDAKIASEPQEETDAQVASKRQSMTEVQAAPEPQIVSRPQTPEEIKAYVKSVKQRMRMLGMQLSLTYQMQLNDDIRQVEQLQAKYARKQNEKIEIKLRDAVIRLQTSVENILVD